ncbi:ENV1 protein, partial [Malurus elegans]|nr:ENV1 protein [Malurus elegans]
LPDKPFLHVLDVTFRSLNQSNPNLTSSCWSCYDVYPPFYEGVALNTSFDYSSDGSPSKCRWDTPRKGITLGQVRGQGICIG